MVYIGSSTRQLDNTEVSVTNCQKGTCKLRRKTDVGITLTFTPGTINIFFFFFGFNN